MTKQVTSMMNLTTFNPKTFDYKKWVDDQVESGAILTDPSKTSLTTRYAEMLIDGTIIASKKNILAAKRHIRDLGRQGTKDFPWIFVEEKAHRPIRFIEKFCRPSKGNFKRLVIQPWQHYAIGSTYGWVHKDTGVRRFRESIVFVARKNGKSTKISGVSLYSASKDGENGADVYLLANTKQQAGIVYEEAQKMVKSSPRLRRQFRAKRDEITYPMTMSKIEHRASDSDKLDGLNTHFGVFDEIHEFKDYKLINVIKNSRGSRTQPLIMYITTAGYQLDGPLVDYYEDANDVLNEILEDERTFYYMAELDDASDMYNPLSWIKANPNIGVSLDLEIMIEDWKKAQTKPEEKTDYITKQFNMFVRSGAQPFIESEILRRNREHIDLEDLRGMNAIGGYDLSDSEDFTSACLECDLGDGRVFILSHSWLPESKVIANNEKIPYREYEELGYLTIVEGEYIKKEYVEDWFIAMSKIYNIELVAFDEAKAFRLNESMKNHGFVTEKVKQTPMVLGPAVDDLREMFIDGKIVFNEDRLFRWYINNVKIKPDRHKNNMPTKQSRYRKIDGFAAFLNAHKHMMGKLVKEEESGKIGVISMSELMGRS